MRHWLQTRFSSVDVFRHEIEEVRPDDITRQARQRCVFCKETGCSNFSNISWQLFWPRRYYDVVWIVTDHKRMVSTMVCGPFKGPQTVAAYIHIPSQIVSKPQTLNPLDGV